MKLPELEAALEQVQKQLEAHEKMKPFPGPRGMATDAFKAWQKTQGEHRAVRDKLFREIDAQEKLLANKPFAPVPPSNEPAPVEDGPADHLAGTKLAYDDLILKAREDPKPRVIVDYQQLVRQFHEVFECVTNEKPTLADEDTRSLRISLVLEEAAEFAVAVRSNDLVEIADGMADILYVVFGSALAFGIDLGAIFLEVQRSNMSKLEDGKLLKRDDGKVLKGKDWSPPALAPILKAQGWEE